MPGRILSVNAAAVSLIAICILSAAILASITFSDHPADANEAATPASSARIEPVATRPMPASPVRLAVGTQPTQNAATRTAAPVTITGCLERDGQAFRLTDTSGEQAPRARSWKSGFLKKGNAAVVVVDTGKKLGLARHVGERVGVAGVLSGRDLQARTLTRVAKACS